MTIVTTTGKEFKVDKVETINGQVHGTIHNSCTDYIIILNEELVAEIKN